MLFVGFIDFWKPNFFSTWDSKQIQAQMGHLMVVCPELGRCKLGLWRIFSTRIMGSHDLVVWKSQNLAIQNKSPLYEGHMILGVPSCKLTWQWKILIVGNTVHTSSNFKWSNFHCYVGLTECNPNTQMTQIPISKKKSQKLLDTIPTNMPRQTWHIIYM